MSENGRMSRMVRGEGGKGEEIDIEGGVKIIFLAFLMVRPFITGDSKKECEADADLESLV